MNEKKRKILRVIIALLAILAMAAMPVLVRERISIMTREDVWAVGGADVLMSSGDLSGGNFDTSTQTLRLEGSTGNIDAEGTLDLTGNAVFSGTLAMAGATTFEGKLTVNDALEVNGDGDEEQLMVQAHSTQNAPVFVVEQSNGAQVFNIANSGATIISGTTALNDDILNDASDSLKLADDVIVTGGMVLSSTLDVQGNVSNSQGDKVKLADDVDITGAVIVSGTTDLQDDVANSAADALKLNDDVYVTGGMVLSSTLDAQSTIANSQSDKLKLADDVDITGDVVMSGTVDIQDDIANSASDSLKLNDDVGITGDVVMSSTLDIQSTIANSASDNVKIDDALDVTGNAVLSSTLVVLEDISDTGGDLTIADNLKVTGAVEANSGDITSTLAVGTWLSFSPINAIAVTQDSWITPTGTFQYLSCGGNVQTQNLYPGSAGQLLLLHNVSNCTITITDTGTVMLSADAALTQYDNLLLLSDGTNWTEVSVSNN